MPLIIRSRQDPMQRSHQITSQSLQVSHHFQAAPHFANSIRNNHQSLRKQQSSSKLFDNYYRMTRMRLGIRKRGVYLIALMMTVTYLRKCLCSWSSFLPLSLPSITPPLPLTSFTTSYTMVPLFEPRQPGIIGKAHADDHLSLLLYIPILVFSSSFTLRSIHLLALTFIETSLSISLSLFLPMLFSLPAQALQHRSNVQLTMNCNQQRSFGRHGGVYNDPDSVQHRGKSSPAIWPIPLDDLLPVNKRLISSLWLFLPFTFPFET